MAAFVCVAVLAGCDASFLGNPSGPRVAVVGDSITAASYAALHSRLDPAYLTGVNALPGLKIAEQIPAAQSYGSASPRVAVVNLGTNDAIQFAQANPSASDAQVADGVARAGADLRTVVAAFGSSPVCVVVVTVSTSLPQPGANRFAAKFDSVQIGGLGRDPRVHVVDWAASVAADSSLVSDQVHPTAAGQARLADLVGAAVDRCV